MNQTDLIIFSDFDGTISSRDVGNRLFHHFSGGRSAEIVSRWKSGRITSRECLLSEAELISPTEKELLAFLETFDLALGFIDFNQRRKAIGAELVILSDGLELYIRHILAKHDLDSIPIFANQGVLTDRGLEISFPFSPGACGSCGNCKGERITEHLSHYLNRPFTVFIGDGLSDRCAVGQVDVVFAKSDLAEYCQTHNIEFNCFDTFDDVTRRLIELGKLVE